MRMNNIVANMIRNFFVIFGVIVLITAILNPVYELSSKIIMIIALFALVSDLTVLVFWSKKELSDKSRMLRRVLHLVLIEMIVLFFGNILGFASGITQNIIFAIEILGIYSIVCWIDWLIDNKTANDINDKLKKMKSKEKNN
ncbi:MAG: DUF3021 family protein [Clostridiales bacterium]|nr:DUF3021 family protein [Clostridiales bacterium]